jgi:S1-C subfamily serine protease
MKLTYDGDLTQCQLSWMVNGTRQETEGTFKLGRYSTAKIELSRAMMEDLGIARQMAFKACDKRWSLTDEQLYEVHRFASMYEEELAWGGPAGKGAAAGRLAPTGGWPKWNVTGLPPTAVTLDKALDGEALFKLLAPSVVTIENFHGKDEALGSGVAISSTEILTNCHVVEGARKIVAKQDKKEWVAKVSRSDPASDRCVLFVPEGNFKPVPGVRTYGDLRVGEALYTLGSPNGLELTLSSGILSGLRELKGRSYVQTTAPISPGSSGGGLFDAYGNVVGITTFVQVDRDRVNQSLNFAIPADSYWQP